MKHLFVPYELAKELKELGFDEPCFGYYDGTGEFYFTDRRLMHFPKQTEYGEFREDDEEVFLAPTHQQVVDWFREKHKIEVCASSYYYPKHYGIVSQIGYSHKSNTEYPESDYGEGLGKRQKHEKVIVYSERNFDDYYSALNAAIDEAIVRIYPDKTK